MVEKCLFAFVFSGSQVTLAFGIQVCLCCKETGVLDLNCNIEDYIKKPCVRLSGIAMWGRIREMVNTPCMSEWPFSP